jgi:ankyrin repeat protein
MYPLLEAIINNNIDIVKLLINYAEKNNLNLEINERNDENYFPIFGAMDNNNLELFKLIVIYAVEIRKVRLKIHEEEIIKVISKNLDYVHLKELSDISNEFMKLLYRYDEKKLITIKYSKNSYYFLNYYKKISEQIEKKKKEREKDHIDTLLTLECKKSNIEKVKLLIKDKSIDINEMNKDGDTPLIIACKIREASEQDKKRKRKLIKYLLRHEKINVNKKSNYGINPLLVACYFNNKEAVESLLKYNADITIQDNKNNLPLHIAYYLNNPEIINILESKDKSLTNVINAFGENPMDIDEEIKINSKDKNYIIDSSDSEYYGYSSNVTNDISFSRDNIKPTNILFNEIDYSMSLIQTNEGFGTGFFIEIPIPSKKNPMYGLITNNHVLNKNHLKTGKSFKIYTALNKN